MAKPRLTWEEWKIEVNTFVIRKTGIHADDLPDWRYREAYDNGMKPNVAANRAIAAAKKEMGIK